HVMSGYLDGTPPPIDGDGWLRTGDMGRLDDDGRLWIVDRKKDLIIRGGNNVSPAEVEALLATHPAVAEVAVVGRPDDYFGGKNAARIAEAARLLDAAGVPHRFVATAPAGGTVQLVADALVADPAIDTAIYMGGDGTFAEVAKGILASGRAGEVRLAMLPTGT